MTNDQHRSTARERDASNPPHSHGAGRHSDVRPGGEAGPSPAQRHQAPSRARYAEAHPPRTVRFNPKADEKILALSELLDVGYNQAVNSAIVGLGEADIEAILARGEELGFQKGVRPLAPPSGPLASQSGPRASPRRPTSIASPTHATAVASRWRFGWMTMKWPSSDEPFPDGFTTNARRSLPPVRPRGFQAF